MGDNPKFYVATLAAAVERAARIAPTKGVAFDKAAGLIMDVDPRQETVSLRATNLEVYYREFVKDVVSYGEETVSWRFPAHLINGVLSGLPLDKEVTFKQVADREVKLFCGRKQARLRLMPAELFPPWVPFDRSELKPVPGFAHRVSQVAWAVDPQMAPYTGVNVDGTHLNATDRYRAARVPCDVALSEPVTVPLSVLSPVFKNLPGEVSLKAEGKALHMCVGDEVDIRTSIYEEDYPAIGKLLDAKTFGFTVAVDREQLYDAVSAMQVLVKNERYPRMTFEFSEDQIDLAMSVPETGDMSDVVECELSDGNFSPGFVIAMSPDYLIKALEAARSKKVRWAVGPEPTGMTFIHDAAEEYSAYLQPMGNPTSTGA